MQEYVKRSDTGNVLHPTSARLIKPVDTLQLGKVYEFSVLPAVYDYRKTTIVPDTSLQVLLNGAAVPAEGHLHLQSGVLLGAIRPQKPVAYTFSGSFPGGQKYAPDGKHAGVSRNAESSKKRRTHYGEAGIFQKLKHDNLL